MERHNPALHWESVSLVLTDDREIARINRAYLDHEGPTDVISFTYTPFPDREATKTGEVLVNVERAFAEGSQRESPSRELALYMAHGCLHLTGADDSTPPQRRAMERIQQRWLQRVRPQKLLNELFA
jgi:probable rRNA maturation factor